MGMPETVRVKLSSDAAGSISITPVVVREMPLRELVEMVLAVTGKDEQRIRNVLLRGVFVAGASRLRWTGWDAGREDLLALLATFPDPEPTRPFLRQSCRRAVLRGDAAGIEVTVELGMRRRWLRRGCFWDALMEAVAEVRPVYAGYSYQERADCYRAALPPDAAARLRSGARLLAHPALARQIERAAFDKVDLYTSR